MKYYFVSYAHDTGFGNSFVSAPHLDIRKMEKKIILKNDFQNAVILSFVEIDKATYERGIK